MEQVTVVIPNYNGIKFLKGCLDALLSQQEAPEFCVCVVDNGSTDGSLELLQEYSQVEVLALPENTGFCHAVNLGIQHSRAPYVLLLNNDTQVETGFVKQLYDSIESREDAFSVSARMLMWDDPSLLDDAGDRYCALGWAYARGKGRPAAQYDKACRVFSACGGAAIYRRSVFERIGLFDEAHFAYLEDLDIGYRARIYGYHNYYEPGAAVIHYGSASSGSRYNAWKTSLASANSVYVICKNMPLLQKLLNLPFFLVGFSLKALFFAKKGFGGLYVKGLLQGIQKSCSKSGRAAKVPFLAKNIKNYFSIQIELWCNLVRFLKKN